jgi:hypothetical protein
MTQFYQELFTVRRDVNEVYLVPVPQDLLGRGFAEIGEMFIRYRNDCRSCLLMGIQRGDEMLINPIGDEAGPLALGDQFILLSRSFPSAAQPLPTYPPLAMQATDKTAT